MFNLRLSTLLFVLLSAMAPMAIAADAKTPPAVSAQAQAQAQAPATPGKVNLNTADAATLQRELSGIGAVKAQAIISYREEHGKFVSPDELLEVKGIGAAILDRNRDKLSAN
jgi:competence protein ComEA